MLKPPHPAAVVGYLAAMLINPNNHALDGGPATAAMEKEAVSQLAEIFGLRERSNSYCPKRRLSGLSYGSQSAQRSRASPPGCCGSRCCRP